MSGFLFLNAEGFVLGDVSKKLEKQYKLENRFSMFGEVIRSVRINGFRGVENLGVPFDFPVVAISGLNGAGKSTIGQICLAGYKGNVSSELCNKRFYLRDFFPNSIADPSPFKDDSSVKFVYETDKPDSPQELTVKRANSSWSGYKRQPERACFYVGFTVYIPKVEKKI